MTLRRQYCMHPSSRVQLYDSMSQNQYDVIIAQLKKCYTVRLLVEKGLQFLLIPSGDNVRMIKIYHTPHPVSIREVGVFERSELSFMIRY